VTLSGLANLVRMRTVIKYACVGGIAACVDIGFFALFAKLLEYSYLWIAAFGFLLATWVNYHLSIIFVFADQRRKRATEIGLVYLVSLLGLGLNQVILFWCVEKAEGELMISKLIATGSVFIWNYLARKYYIFAERPMT